jgi:RNA polymerase sigma-70 factor (ECF subfamily)
MSAYSEAEAAPGPAEIPRPSRAKDKAPSAPVEADLSTREGFERFVLDCQERVFRFLLRKGVPAQDALELRQDAFLTLWKNRSKPRNPQTFLMGVANRLAMAHHRKSVRLQTVSIKETTTPLPAPQPAETETALDKDHLSPELLAMLNALTNRQRQVIELVWLQNIPREEAADRLGITQGALRYHEKMAMDQLRESGANLPQARRQTKQP